jgi:predicted RNA methylase
MSPSKPSQPAIFEEARGYWRDRAARDGAFSATRSLAVTLWQFVRDSTPDRRKARFGDAGYDWDFHVNTTSGAVGWRDRLLGVLHSPYQPTEPDLFREMMSVLEHQTDLAEYTFIDLGSGKGRALLMASNYPFRRIVGVELLPALHEIARENIARYKSESQKSLILESVCADAAAFPVPDGPIVIYLFNPFPESGLQKAVANLEHSLRTNPRPMFVIYHNPQLGHVFERSPAWRKIAGTNQYSIFSAQQY